MKQEIRNVLEKVAKNGCKGTSDNINERVMIQALTDILAIIRESLPEKKKEIIGQPEIFGYNQAIDEITKKLEGEQWIYFG